MYYGQYLHQLVQEIVRLQAESRYKRLEFVLRILAYMYYKCNFQKVRLVIGISKWAHLSITSTFGFWSSKLYGFWTVGYRLMTTILISFKGCS